MTISERPVAVSAGSPRSHSRDVLGCLATHVWFPPMTVLRRTSTIVRHSR